MRPQWPSRDLPTRWPTSFAPQSLIRRRRRDVADPSRDRASLKGFVRLSVLRPGNGAAIAALVVAERKRACPSESGGLTRAVLAALRALAVLSPGEHQAQHDADPEERGEQGEGVGRHPDGESDDSAEQHSCCQRNRPQILLVVTVAHDALPGARVRRVCGSVPHRSLEDHSRSSCRGWFRDNVRRLRPEHRPVDPADRLVWLPGDAAQCDSWFPPQTIPLEDGSTTLLPVLVITAAHSRFMVGRMTPTRITPDLLLGTGMPTGGSRTPGRPTPGHVVRQGRRHRRSHRVRLPVVDHRRRAAHVPPGQGASGRARRSSGRRRR
jgi:hypothetical protein